MSASKQSTVVKTQRARTIRHEQRHHTKNTPMSSNTHTHAHLCSSDVFTFYSLISQPFNFATTKWRRSVLMPIDRANRLWWYMHMKVIHLLLWSLEYKRFQIQQLPCPTHHRYGHSHTTRGHQCFSKRSSLAFAMVAGHNRKTPPRINYGRSYYTEGIDHLTHTAGSFNALPN